MNYQKLLEHPILKFIRNYALWILIIFYSVGVIAIGIFKSEIFTGLTPLILLLSVFLLIISHHERPLRLGIFFVISFIIGLLVEYIGIHTGILFGDYHYGENLGWKIYEVPLMIGINWFLLSFSAGYFIRYFFDNGIIRIVLASALMVFTDFFIEPVAQLLDYWQWDGAYVPSTNYFHWFLIGLLVQIIFYFAMKGETNKLAAPYYIILTLFFVLINLLP